jgi:acyl-CoA synthetase (AMP-forming)/AMP-acid ligase II
MPTEPRLPDTIQSIPDALRFWAERTPEAPAFISPGRPTTTYGALWAAANDLANRLDRLDIRRGDRVALLLPEGVDLAVALLGTTSAAIALPLDNSATQAELGSRILASQAVAAIVAGDVPPAARECLSRHGLSVIDIAVKDTDRPSGLESRIGRIPLARPHDIAFAVQTSGTTARPKLVPSEHGCVVQDGRSHRDRFGLDRHDRALAVAPLWLSLGLCVLTHSIVAGSAVIFPDAVDIAGLWRTVEETHPTWMFPSSGFVALLAQFLRERPHLAAPASLRFVRVTAAPLSSALCEEIAARLGTLVLFSYSSSEASLIATALPPPDSHKPGSSGRPVQEVRIVDDSGRDALPGDEGEIWVRGPKVFAGYLDDPETNAAVLLPDGWFRTGDLGFLDVDGFLFVTGRRDERINRGGAKIVPATVEDVFLAHPAVADAAVFPLPDERLGEEIGVAIVLREGQAVTSRELRDWMLDRVSPHVAPRRIWFVPELPRSASGKVQRKALTERLWHVTESRVCDVARRRP